MAQLISTRQRAESRGTAASAGPGRSRFVIKPTKTSCIVLGVLTGLSLIASGGLYYVKSGEIDDLSRQITQKRTDLANSEKIAGDLKDVQATNDKTRADLKFLETAVTQNQYVPTLLHQTELLAQSTNLRVDSIRPTLEPAPLPPADKEAAKKFKAPPYDKLHVDMEVTGQYWNVAQMLYRLTEFPKIMTVESVQMMPAADKTGSGSDMTVKLKLTGFIFKSDSPAPPVAPATPGNPAPVPAGTKA
jgi:Tfp pilus assembly protein PilO